jgi:type II secretory pathway component PulJ
VAKRFSTFKSAAVYAKSRAVKVGTPFSVERFEDGWIASPVDGSRDQTAHEVGYQRGQQTLERLEAIRQADAQDRAEQWAYEQVVNAIPKPPQERCGACERPLHFCTCSS